MNPYLDKLYQIAGKSSRLVIGLMSGTSLDGLDLALCRITGSGTATQLELLQFETVSYDSELKDSIRSVFSRRDADLETITLLNADLAIRHAGTIRNVIAKWGLKPEDIDLIASHGQTIYHAPRSLHGQAGLPNATLQIVDGDHIAVCTGIITICDFRQKHIAAGGEGAPLAVYGDYLLFAKPGENRIMLNIGGIANFTYLPGDPDTKKIFSTDTGPGNTLMDAWVQARFPGKHYDENATLASKGQCNERLLQQLKDHSFFAAGFPKTTGPELFNLTYLAHAMRVAGINEIETTDLLATLNRFTAETIADAIHRCFPGSEPIHIYASGGGMHNPLLMRHLQALLPAATFSTTASLQVNPDAKEAVLFALLANETVAGGPIQIGTKDNGIPAVRMGKICLPN